MALLLSQLVICCIPATSSATTLIVFYNPSDGVILATDSSVGVAKSDEVKSGRAISSSFRTECKIRTCGRYFVPESGFGGIIGRSNIPLACSDVGSSQDIEILAGDFMRQALEELTNYVSYLVQMKEAPAIDDALVSTVIAGYERGHSVLRYFDLSFAGVEDSKLRFRVTKKIACPGATECGDLKLVAGQKDAILARQGRHKNANNLLLLAEELVQTEIDAHRKTRYVLPPISVVQIKNETPRWFRLGLCVAK